MWRPQTSRGESLLVYDPDAAASGCSHGLGAVVGGAEKFEFGKHLAELFLHVQKAGDAGAIREPHGEATEEFELAEHPGGSLHGHTAATKV